MAYPIVNISRVQFEHHTRALGIGESQPRLSWRIDTNIQSWIQDAYQIEAFDTKGHLRFSSGRVESNQSVLVEWPFEPLRSREQLFVKVRVWGVDGSASEWSDQYSVETGLLHVDDWTAKFISPNWDEDTSVMQPLPMMRRTFTCKPNIMRARLYISSLGIYEAHINGVVVGDHVFDPGWTSYKHRLQYQTFDVTTMLRTGQNTMGVFLGDGWFRGRLGFGGGRRNIYGDKLALIAQLEIFYADGTTERIVSDESWRATTGPVLSSGIYEGETYDARLEKHGWSSPGFDDRDWFGVVAMDHDLVSLVAPLGPPVRRTQLISPQSIFKSPSGRTLVDFGQNLVGRLRIMVNGRAGQTITLRHAEVLEDGELGTRPLRNAQATDRYTLRGGATEVWEPRFTFHGFRYVEVEGWPGELCSEDINAVVIHSDMQRTGWFECSDSLLNKLHENVVWSMRGNFLSIPTDCPQRDERLGWTGDLQVFSPTASYLYDVAGFLSSWLRDLSLEQKDFGGIVPIVVPYMLDMPIWPATAWGDAAVVVPWVLYQRFGDMEVLRSQFESMRTWVDVIANIAGEKHIWNQEFQFGDWLDPTAPPDKPAKAQTEGHLVATAYFARSAEWVGLAAKVLDLEDESERYLTLAKQIRQAFANEYIAHSGQMVNDAQTAYALALEFDLFLSQQQRQHASERLVALVESNDYRIGTGFVGTPLICDALTNTSNIDVAYRLVLQRECPSWLYPVTMGATTIWERWDSMLADGSINSGEMTSFNHYAFGAVADWLHRVVGGLAPAEPGYKKITFQPRPGGGIRNASATHITPYGLAEISWQIADGNIEVNIVVPPNAVANVILPGREAERIEVGSGEHRWSYSFGE
jgi:alpha-L-rhamnosidase